MSERSSSPTCGVRLASIARSNSSRNFATIAPTGIAIESPSTQRQWPMMFS